MTRDRSIGEVAALTGLSIRSLRHLETKNLIRPRRSEAGRRVYGEADMQRITRVLLLRQAGYRLTEISSVMIAPSLDARSLVESQILHLGARHRQLGLMLRRLEETLILLDTRDAPDADRLCSLINEAQTIMTRNELKTVASQYFTEAEWERWQTLGAELFPDSERSRYERDWSELIAQVEAAIDRGVEPGSAQARTLLDRWMALQAPMVEALGREHWVKAAKMYENIESWESDTVKAPFSAAVYRFMAETGRIVREAAPACKPRLVPRSGG
ncbi:MerR family transcriptional regulator [Asaia lannensis]|uniref:MerR family transcriptional regulator n=1 Tax=Asaia lannensis NBRC 102526 TaxID=1307926 RepID=A0ABT1CDU5_9PROT|nr:MerR family transcriptional regulator [Asaia lannensis]MCO6159032.1 MerR family transcriptional regulator [Asaia lannensis NBRC 102526]